MPGAERILARLALAALAGALAVASLAPLSWWAAALLACALLYVALAGSPGRFGAAAAAFAFGLGLHGLGASWIYCSIVEFGLQVPVLAGFLTLCFAALMAAVGALPWLAWPLVRGGGPAAFAALWLAGEHLRELAGFPWLFVGYGLMDTPLHKWAPLGGVLGLGFAAAFGAAAAAHLCLHPRRAAAYLWPLAALLPWLAAPLLPSLYGTALPPLSYALVQGNIDQHRKWQWPYSGQVVDAQERQSEPHWGADLVLWSEAAIPLIGAHQHAATERLSERAAAGGTSLVVGLPTVDSGGVHNSMMALGEGSGTWHKRRLVPFGEYIPLRNILGGALRLFDMPLPLQTMPGDAAQAHLRLGAHSALGAICYEIAFAADMARRSRDAQLILTVSNDSWFGDSLGPHQHMQMARMRALENARPVLRATNNGITAAVDARGNILGQLTQFRAAVLVGAIEPRTGTTPFARHGNLPMLIVAGLIVVAAGWRPVLAATRRLPGLS